MKRRYFLKQILIAITSCACLPINKAFAYKDHASKNFEELLFNGLKAVAVPYKPFKDLTYEYSVFRSIANDFLAIDGIDYSRYEKLTSTDEQIYRLFNLADLVLTAKKINQYQLRNLSPLLDVIAENPDITSQESITRYINGDVAECGLTNKLKRIAETSNVKRLANDYKELLDNAGTVLKVEKEFYGYFEYEDYREFLVKDLLTAIRFFNFEKDNYCLGVHDQIKLKDHDHDFSDLVLDLFYKNNLVQLHRKINKDLVLLAEYYNKLYFYNRATSYIKKENLVNHAKELIDNFNMARNDLVMAGITPDLFFEDYIADKFKV